MEWEFVAMVAPVVAGLVGVWVNLQQHGGEAQKPGDPA